MSEDTGCEERGAVGAAERGGSGEEGAGEKDGAGGIPSMEKGSALQERRSGERRQGKEDRGSAGEGLSQGGAPYQWAAGGGVTRLTADGTGRRALESSCDCDRALCLLSLVGLAVEPAYPGTGGRAAGREAWAWGSGGVSWAEEGLRERGCCCEGEEEMGGDGGPAGSKPRRGRRGGRRWGAVRGLAPQQGLLGV